MIFTKKQVLTPRQQIQKDLRDYEYAALEHEDKAAYHEALAQHYANRIKELQRKLSVPEIVVDLPTPVKSWNPLEVM